MTLNQATSTETRIVEVRRTGAGGISETETSFVWDGETHSGIQGDLKFKLTAKVPRKEMPGSNEVVHHAMAATWQPFEFQGEWDDRWMGQGQAWTTFLDFARMVSRIPLVRLTVDVMSWVGILTDLEITYRTVDRVGWQCTISPESNETVRDVFFSGPVVLQKSIPQWLLDVRTQSEALQSLQDDVQDLSLSTQDLADQNASLSELSDATARADSIGTNGLSEDASRQLLILATTFRRVRSAGINAALAVSRKRGDLAVAFDSILQTLRYEQWVHQTTIEAWRAVGLSRSAEVDMRSRASTHPRAVYRPKRGESLERISMRFYGTPDNAMFIYNANHLTSLLLTGTEELIIPERGV